MKNVKIKLFLFLALMLTTCWAFSGINVYGGLDMYLINDNGSSPGSWEHVINKLASATSLKNGPSSGNSGSFYYFKHAGDGTREMSDAVISKTVTLNADQRTLCSLNQLQVNFLLDYFGWDSDDEDRFVVSIYSIKADGKWSTIFSSSSYVGEKYWRRLNMPTKALPPDTVKVEAVITAFRESGSDLDVYLDNILLWLVDENPPVMTEATVTEIRDWQGNLVPFKKDTVSGEYLDNWVNPADTIYGNIRFNEPVRVNYPEITLNTNVLNQYGNRVYAEIDSTSWHYTAHSTSHQYSIPLGHKCQISGEDNKIKFMDSLEPIGAAGPFDYAVQDLGGNQGPSGIMKPNIEHYNIKFDNASPVIVTSWDSYEEYAPGRSSVQIVAEEEDMGKEQSPVTLTYFWEYMNSTGFAVREEEKSIVLNDATAHRVSDGTKTTYIVTLAIPNGSKIPPYQEFRLYAEVNDEARSPYGNRFFYGKVNQKDSTPPVITWDKSIHEDGREVDISTSEDTLYTTSRTVSFSAEDIESGVDEVKYIWTREAYNIDSSSFKKVVLPGEDGKYTIETVREDTPLEGIYYLNILAVNGTDEEVIIRKGFYFDCEGPRVTYSEFKDIDGKPASAHYQVKDRALQNKFLYALLTTMEDGILDFEPIAEPDISEGIKDSGMWKVLDLEGTGEERTANIMGVLDGVELSGHYKLVTRYYDEFYNYTEYGNTIWYDFEPPELILMGSADGEPFEPENYKRDHSVKVHVIDNISGANLLNEEVSVNWIDADSREVISADFETENDQFPGIKVYGNENLNGIYYLKIKVKDYAENVLEEILSIDGNPVEFCFDNSPPEVTIVCDASKKLNTVMFSYSGLKDEYSDISLFRYGISDTPGGEPETWIDIDTISDSGEVIHFGDVAYPEDSITEGKWYLSVMLQDALGNERIIHCPEVFDIDATKPAGSVSFEKDFTNSLEVSLKLTVDELAEAGNKVFKTVLADDGSLLSEASIDDEAWKDIIFENGIAYYNWTLSGTDEVEQRVYVRFMDKAGNLSEIYSDSIILDRTAPTGEVTYDVTVPTKGNVTAALTMDDNFGVDLLNKSHASLDGEKYKFVFNRNGEFEFIISDEAGNRTRITAEVNNIDKDPPKAVVKYVWTENPSIIAPRDQWTNESITAQLQLEDDNGYVILSEGGDTHIFNDNGEFLFRFRDNLGNEGSIKAEVKNIDKAPPVGSIIYTSSDTAPVTVYLSVYEPVKVTNNNGSFRHVFEENGSFDFMFEDKAGNNGIATAEVYTITPAEKYANIVYNNDGKLTNNDISAEYTTFSDRAIITSPTVAEEVYGYTHEFTENGEFPVSIRVLSDGDTITVTGSVYNIDRTAPEAEVILSTTELTNQNVTVELLTYDDRGKEVKIKNNNGSNILEFTENGSFTFELMDEAGNIGYKTVTVSNIDKNAPVGEIEYIRDTDKNIISARVFFPKETEEVIILNNNGSDTFEFVENGAFVFEYSDAAGNKGETTAEVTDFSNTISAGTIEYYIDGIKVVNPDAIPINKSVTAKLIPEASGGPYTILNNGGSDSYTFDKNGEFTFVFADVMGNKGFAKAAVSKIDKIAPKLQILADIVYPTQSDVTLTISYSDDKGIASVDYNMEAENLTVSEGKLIYICTENKRIQITVIDTAGNETSREYTVDYIDREAPVGTIEYDPDGITNQDVRAVLTLDEPGRVLNNNGKMEYIFTENGEFTFEFEDDAGNRGQAVASVNRIDKIPPKGSLEYSHTEMTSRPVTVTLKADSDAIITNNGGMTARTFYTNGYFTFRITDEAGNIVSLNAEVWNIDEERPQISLKGNSYECIMLDEPYVEAGYKATDNIDGDITGRVTVEGSVNTAEAGTYLLKYKVSDAVGNSAEETRTVRVLESGELVLLLNGKAAEGSMMLLNARNIAANALGNEGDFVIKWGEGRRTIAWFKGNGNTIAAGGNVWLEAGRWYTFFVQDRDRRTKSIQVYINE
ncbi:MAG: immunoglobulin-like domain-containing protein [Acetivibrionales bacterium]